MKSALAGCGTSPDATRIPLQPEATRLLMNRCSGPLFSLERLERGFIFEEIGTSWGETSQSSWPSGTSCYGGGHHHWSCRAPRNDSSIWWQPMSWPARPELMIGRELVAQHREGVEFKIAPIRSTLSREALAERR